MKYFILPFGCQMNLSDAERLQQVIEEMGYTKAETEADAQLLGIVACSVRQKAIDRVYSKIHNWNLRKRKENILTFVSGCILDNDHGKFLNLFDLVFRMSQISELSNLIKTYGVTTAVSHNSSLADNETVPPEQPEEIVKIADPKPMNPLELSLKENLEEQKKLWKIKPVYSSTFEAYVPIQNGCDKYCTFCAVPYTRGREVSRPSKEIINETCDLLSQGYRSITLLGQNVNSYGLDKQNRTFDASGRNERELTFPQLLREIGEHGTEIYKERNEKAWIYFTSPHPRDMTDEVIDIIAEYPVLAKQIHLPLQSGDDEILHSMNRKYRLEDYRKIIEKIRKTIPEATIFTDIIVGFSGETEEQFLQTKYAMEEFSFDMAFIAQYSPRPGAVSSRWEDDVPHEEKKRRFEVLSQVLKESSGKQNNKRIGRELPVLITGLDRKPGFYTARTEGRINIRIPGEDPQNIGSIAQVKVEKSNGLTLYGTINEGAYSHE